MFIKNLKDYIYIFGVYLKNNVDKNNIFYKIYKNGIKYYTIVTITELLYFILYVTWFRHEIIFDILFIGLNRLIMVAYFFITICMILKTTIWENL